MNSMNENTVMAIEALRFALQSFAQIGHHASDNEIMGRAELFMKFIRDHASGPLPLQKAA